MKTFWTFFYWYLIDKTKIYFYSFSLAKIFWKKKSTSRIILLPLISNSFVLNLQLASQSILEIPWWNTLKPNWKCFGAQLRIHSLYLWKHWILLGIIVVSEQSNFPQEFFHKLYPFLWSSCSKTKFINCISMQKIEYSVNVILQYFIFIW